MQRYRCRTQAGSRGAFDERGRLPGAICKARRAKSTQEGRTDLRRRQRGAFSSDGTPGRVWYSPSSSVRRTRARPTGCVGPCVYCKRDDACRPQRCVRIWDTAEPRMFGRAAGSTGSAVLRMKGAWTAFWGRRRDEVIARGATRLRGMGTLQYKRWR